MMPVWRRSIDAFVLELRRAETLGIPYVVTHPGAHGRRAKRRRWRGVATALDEVEQQTRDFGTLPLLENTAGQGTCLGCRFEQLAGILDGVASADRIGVCLDTCHAFAAGYPLGTVKEYRATMRALNRTIGIERVKAIHLNDSRKPLGSRVDRHEHIGRGEMGLEPFRLLLTDRRFRRVPMYLETPKGEENGADLDAINLAVLRGLTDEDGAAARQPRAVRGEK